MNGKHRKRLLETILLTPKKMRIPRSNKLLSTRQVKNLNTLNQKSREKVLFYKMTCRKCSTFTDMQTIFTNTCPWLERSNILRTIFKLSRRTTCGKIKKTTEARKKETEGRLPKFTQTDIKTVRKHNSVISQSHLNVIN